MGLPLSLSLATTSVPPFSLLSSFFLPPSKTQKMPTAPKNRKGPKGAKGGKRRKVHHKFHIDCEKPVSDGIMDAAFFEKFLHDHIKVNGKAGVLGNVVTITRDKTTISVSASIDFSKRYLKYLTKKFLKKTELRDVLRVIAHSKNGYALQYFDIPDADDE